MSKGEIAVYLRNHLREFRRDDIDDRNVAFTQIR